MPLSSVVGAQSIIKPGVCTSSTRPAVPFEGQMIYETDTDRTLVYNATAWVIPNSPAQNPQGLELITTATCSSGGTASGGVITIGSAVSSVAVANAFNSTYDNYQIVLSGSDSSSLNNIVTMQLNNSTGSTYNSSSFYIIHGGATGSNTQTSGGIFRFAWGGDVSDTSANVTVYSPFLTKRTAISGQTTNASLTAFNGGVDTNAVSNTGFTLSVGVDTLTGGTIRVYGYRNS